MLLYSKEELPLLAWHALMRERPLGCLVVLQLAGVSIMMMQCRLVDWVVRHQCYHQT